MEESQQDMGSQSQESGLGHQLDGGPRDPKAQA
jgi:hypothetical protein